MTMRRGSPRVKRPHTPSFFTACTNTVAFGFLVQVQWKNVILLFFFFSRINEVCLRLVLTYKMRLIFTGHLFTNPKIKLFLERINYKNTIKFFICLKDIYYFKSCLVTMTLIEILKLESLEEIIGEF